MPEPVGINNWANSILIDTNIFLLLIVGKIDQDLISSFKRTNVFTKEDYQRLIQFLSGFNHFIVTPNILTEVSNLIGQLREPKRSQAFQLLNMFLSELIEVYIPSKQAAKSDRFINLGLTDSAIIEVAANGLTTLTDDFALYGTLFFLGKDVINFNHLRGKLA